MSGTGVIGISRHRIGVDGMGVTTLVAFHGCTLNCLYCLNPKSIVPDGIWMRYTPEELYRELKKDELYFLATGGGVTFGGGEPCLRSDFIRRFRDLCGKEWRINLETALNVPTSLVEALLPVIDHWIVDIKDMNPEIYKAYTGEGNEMVVRNLKLLAECGCKVTARVPLIPGFNTETDLRWSIVQLETLGITDIEQFTYIKKEH